MGVKEQAKQFDQKNQNLTQGDRNIQLGLDRTQASKRSRLNPAPLQAAGCDQSTNPTVKGIWEAVVDYNAGWKHPTTRQASETAHALACLDYIYYSCSDYMTSKVYKTMNSSGNTAKRKLRYEAFDKLLQEVATELESYGGKTLVGPTNFTVSGKRNYWLERLDPKNRAGYLISVKYDQWRSIGTDGVTFWEWLKANGGSYIKTQSKVNGYNNPNSAQWEHQKHFVGSVLCNADDTYFTTNLLETAFSGNGWGVWVCSLLMANENNSDFGNFIFSNTHKAGYDHHSSFLGGSAVLAAGEWVVDSTGTIKVITGKSGHYMPKWENLHRFVNKFQCIPGNAIIRPDMLDHKAGTDKIKFYRVHDFRTCCLNAKPLNRATVFAAIGSANTNIDEHFSVSNVPITKSLSSLLPP